MISRNNILRGSVIVAIILFIISVCCIDSATMIPTITATLSLGYLFLMYLANKEGK